MQTAETKSQHWILAALRLFMKKGEFFFTKYVERNTSLEYNTNMEFIETTIFTKQVQEHLSLREKRRRKSHLLLAESKELNISAADVSQKRSGKSNSERVEHS